MVKADDPPPAQGHADCKSFTFFYNLDLDANDLHVRLNTDASITVVEDLSTPPLTPMPVVTREGEWIHMSGGGVALAGIGGARFKFAGWVPDGQDLQILDAKWTWDGEVIGPAEFIPYVPVETGE